MGSVGGPKTTARPDLFNGALGVRTADTVEDIFTKFMYDDNYTINPNYYKDRKYRVNCALCAVAVALQLMGYDVEAMPKDIQWRGFNSVFDVDYENTDNYILSGGRGHFNGMPTPRELVRRGDFRDLDDVPVAKRGAKAVAEQIFDKISSWGDGAFGVLNVKHKETNSGHAVNVVNIKGKMYVYDGQDNTMIAVGRETLQRYLSNHTANWTSLVRLDNAPIRKNVKDLDKIVKKRNS